MNLNIIYAALFAHWVADFPVQAIGHKWMGQKATKLSHLLAHGYAYLLAFWAVFWVAGHPSALASNIAAWIALNAAAHVLVDFWTSKATKAMWDRSGVHQVTMGTDLASPGRHAAAILKPIRQPFVGAFFSTIGLDQMVHYVILFWSGAALGVFQ